MPNSMSIKENHETKCQLSDRNQLPGTLKEIKMGQTTSHLKIDIGNGQILTDAITNEAVDELAFKVGDQV